MATKKTQAERNDVHKEPSTENLSPESENINNKAQTANTESKKRYKPKTLSQPFFTTAVELKSLQAQRVMNRTFKSLAGSLFRSDVIFRIIKDDSAADALELTIKDLLDPVAKELSKAISQAEVLIKKHKIQSLPNYTYPRSYDIEIKSPQIATYATMVSELDILMLYLDSLWIMGKIDNKSRQYQTFNWQQRLIKLANRIIHIERQARKHADELGKTDQVEALAPKADLVKAELDLTKEDDEDESDSPPDGGDVSEEKTSAAA